MGKYNQYGVDKFGNVDPTRRVVHEMVGLFGSQGGLGTRKMADDLYSWMKKNKGSDGDKGDDDKGDDNKGDGNGNGKGNQGIQDIDFNMQGELRKPKRANSNIPTIPKGPLPKVPENMPDIVGKIPEVPSAIPRTPSTMPSVPRIGNRAMNQGGIVRGVGKAVRGHGRGKMV